MNKINKTKKLIIKVVNILQLLHAYIQYSREQFLDIFVRMDLEDMKEVPKLIMIKNLLIACVLLIVIFATIDILITESDKRYGEKGSFTCFLSIWLTMLIVRLGTADKY